MFSANLCVIPSAAFSLRFCVRERKPTPMTASSAHSRVFFRGGTRVWTCRVPKCTMDVEVHVNGTPIGKLLKGGDPVVTWKPETYKAMKGYGKKQELTMFEVDPSLLRKLNAVNFVNTATEKQEGAVDLEIIHLNYPDKDGKNKALKDIRFYNNQTFHVKGSKPGSSVSMKIMFE